MYMTYTSVSPKYQVVIPKEVRERLAIHPKQRLIVMAKGGIVHLIPERPLKELKGLFKGRGLDLKDLRDKEDRL